MHILECMHDCCGCHACASVCPKQCIHMEEDKEGFLYPIVDDTLCVQCELCKSVCPVLNSVIPEMGELPEAMAAIHMDDAVRNVSSSGGVFTALVQTVLARGGVVFGAAWEDNFRRVRHIAVSSVEELSALQGSKYLQSTIGTSYIQVRELLEQGREVLFSGTPCQVEGLYSFLGKKYENLILVDIVCHGVPSPMVWQKYVSWQEETFGASVSGMFFRDKKTGWKRFSTAMSFDNGKRRIERKERNHFMQAFLENACLRPSCYNCRFKKCNRVSDLTLADFWGIEDVCPDMDDDRGTSLVLVHTSKGEKMLKTTPVKLCGVSLDAALKGNSAAVLSVPMHPKRKEFLDSLEAMPFDQAVNTWVRRPLTLKNRIGSLLEMLGIIKAIKKLLAKL